jgi:hypothetical protein
VSLPNWSMLRSALWWAALRRNQLRFFSRPNSLRGSAARCRLARRVCGASGELGRAAVTRGLHCYGGYTSLRFCCIPDVGDRDG